MTLKEAWKLFQNNLSSIYNEHELKEIFIFLAREITGFSRADMIVNSNHVLGDEKYLKLVNAINLLENNTPVQYILGYTWFYGLKISVAPGVLIPRPETEELVDLVVKDNISTPGLRIIDFCTGSGCIAIALNLKLKNPEVIGIDISPEALKIAEANAKYNNAGVHFLRMDILTNDLNGLECPDIIVSNPPYIPISEISTIDKNVLEHEPSVALFVPDDDPLIFYKKIVEYAKSNLKLGGKLYFEIHEKMASQILELLERTNFKAISLINDLNNKPRIVKCMKG